VIGVALRNASVYLNLSNVGFTTIHRYIIVRFITVHRYFFGAILVLCTAHYHARYNFQLLITSVLELS